MHNDRITERDHKRHLRFFKFFRPIMACFFKHKFNYEWDDLSNIKGPYLLLSNHNTNYDPILVGIATGNQLYFVASEHIMQKGFVSRLLDYFLHPILHLKGKAGVNTISSMLRSLKAGYNVAIFPEGNRSFNGVTCAFEPTIGRLARKSGAKLVTFRMEGGYLTQPRWSFTLRKGHMTGRIVHVYSVEELQSMTDDEINAAIVHDMFEDAYATEAREQVPFKGKKLAYGLETTLFTCPQCKKIGTLHSRGNTISCTCGYLAEYNEYGNIVSSGASDKVETVTALDYMQRKNLEDLLADNSTDNTAPLFEDEVCVMEVGEKHSIRSTRDCVLRAFRDHFEVGEHSMIPSDLAGMAIHSRNTIVAHLAENGVQYEIKGRDKMFSALKYLYLYELVR